MKKLLVVAIACLFVAGFSVTAKAVSLVPGQTIFSVPGTFSLPGGSVLDATVNTGFTAPGSFSGTLIENVYSDPTGTLFEYTFSNTGSSADDAIEHLSANGYTGFTTDVDATAPGVVPTSIFRSSSGNVLNFYFQPLGVPGGGSSSDTLWIQTNAKGYTLNNTGLLDGVSTNVTTYGPATPEPATMLMFGIGALGLVGLRKRKENL